MDQVKEITKVLFVCLGNICRSPTAHAVFRSKVRDMELQYAIQVDSAGTGSWHIGSPPDERSIQIAEINGYDMSGIFARQICADDFEEFDYILAMDKYNMYNIQRVKGFNESVNLDYFLSFRSTLGAVDIPDPYYGKGDGFSNVLELIEEASDGLLDYLKTKITSVS